MKKPRDNTHITIKKKKKGKSEPLRSYELMTRLIVRDQRACPLFNNPHRPSPVIERGKAGRKRERGGRREREREREREDSVSRYIRPILAAIPLKPMKPSGY